jgi:hypothetical protein
LKKRLWESRSTPTLVIHIIPLCTNLIFPDIKHLFGCGIVE